MKPVNLQSILSAKENLDDKLFSKYLNYYGLNFVDGGSGKGIRIAELNDLNSFVENLTSIDHEPRVLNNYYLDYCIPQIGKEFDLLRFGRNCIINIELKHTSTKEKITKQLRRNSYYLNFIQKEVFLYTYVVNGNKLYKFNNDDIIEIEMDELANKLESQSSINISSVDDLFDPKYYLVSPFNSTDKFINEKYFLTEQQEEVKNKIKLLIENSKKKFISLTGSAGTGKTLLTYDIAKEFNPIILHCAKLNEGQMKLNDEYEWHIFATKYGFDEDFSSYNLIIVDEAQRAQPSQIKKIEMKVEEFDLNCIFSYDKKQCLSNNEIKNNITQYIETLSGENMFKLTEKIRTNKEIISFVDSLINRKKHPKLNFYSRIKLCYCKNNDQASALLINFHEDGWKVINYTPSQFSTFKYEKYYILGESNAHSIIGQEYDNVVAVIDNNFNYNEDGILKSIHNDYYSQICMLYQIMTRARKMLYVVIIDNEIVLKRCLDLLLPDSKDERGH